MREITVISGKGGTGKTSITAALASLGKNMVLCDSDVDAADLHLILKPTILESFPFEGSWIASIIPEICTNCGLCSEYCRFDAISSDHEEIRRIDPFKCEGCRLCERICPSRAINSTRSANNHWFISDTRMGKMTHASMGPGEENSGKLVAKVRTKAREIAKYLKKQSIPLLARLPFHEEFIDALIKGQTIVEYDTQSPIAKILKSVWEKLSA